MSIKKYVISQERTLQFSFNISDIKTNALKGCDINLTHISLHMFKPLLLKVALQCDFEITNSCNMFNMSATDEQTKLSKLKLLHVEVEQSSLCYV